MSVHTKRAGVLICVSSAQRSANTLTMVKSLKRADVRDFGQVVHCLTF